jgi:hypothetical protein
MASVLCRLISMAILVLQPAQSFLFPSPTKLMAVFYCLTILGVAQLSHWAAACGPHYIALAGIKYKTPLPAVPLWLPVDSLVWKRVYRAIA